MKLIDFYDDLRFMALRQHMGANAEGHFELFDPTKHASLEQRSLLKTQGLFVKATRLTGIKGKSLNFLDCKVVAVDSHQRLHFTKCLNLKRDADTALRLYTHLSEEGLMPIQVCESCIDYWQGSQSGRRRQRYPNSQAFQDVSALIKGLKLGRGK